MRGAYDGVASEFSKFGIIVVEENKLPILFNFLFYLFIRK